MVQEIEFNHNHFCLQTWEYIWLNFIDLFFAILPDFPRSIEGQNNHFSTESTKNIHVRAFESICTFTREATSKGHREYNEEWVKQGRHIQHDVKCMDLKNVDWRMIFEISKIRYFKRSRREGGTHLNLLSSLVKSLKVNNEK